MRVLVCGGRDYADRMKMKEILDDLHVKTPITCLIQGSARGADRLAKNWAFFNQIVCEEYAASWEEYGKAAGHMRNAKMLVEGKPDIVIAFPGGKGTADMVRKAKTANVKTLEVY